MPLGPKAAATVAKLRESIATRARTLPLARHAWARYRRRRYEHRVERFFATRTVAPIACQPARSTKRRWCNLHCEFCYVIDFLNIEGEWRQEMTLDRLRQASPISPDFRSA